MSDVQAIAEWLFGETKIYKYFDFKPQLKIFPSSIGKVYLVCGILENAKDCLYGKEAADFLEISSVTVILCYCPERNTTEDLINI